MMEKTLPSGFILSDAAMYAFQCQDVYPDLLSFAVAIPDHLKQLFLIPVHVEMASIHDEFLSSIASRLASPKSQTVPTSVTPTGESDVSDLFSYDTFVYNDNSPNMPPAGEGSINDAYQMPDDIPAAQPGDQFVDGEPRYDARIWGPDAPSFMTDGDSTDLLINEGYPYRTDEKVRHSSLQPLRVRLAIKPEILQEHAPDKTRERAKTCAVSFVSYQKPTRMYTFSVNCGNVPHMVRAVLSEIDEVTMTCDCPFWRWGGPEFHAKAQNFLLGKPRGTATPPDVRDPDRKHWLCKHAYAVLRRLENHVQQVVDEHWDEDEHDLLNSIDAEWDRLSQDVEIPLEEIESDEPELIETEETEPETELLEEEEELELPEEDEELELPEEPEEEEEEEFEKR